MTANPPEPNVGADTFGDYRRAAAMITHHARGDGYAVYTLLHEASEKGRWAELTLAVVGLYEMLVPNLTNDDTIATINQLAVKWANKENDQ